MRLLGISFRIKMKQTINIGGIAEFAVIEIQTVLDSIDLDGKIFTFRHVIDNGADFCEIYGHWHYFHDPCFEASSECYDFQRTAMSVEQPFFSYDSHGGGKRQEEAIFFQKKPLGKWR